MSQETKLITLYLTGPKANLTGIICGCQVTDGAIVVDASHDGLIQNLKKYYAASETKPSTKPAAVIAPAAPAPTTPVDTKPAAAK